MNRRHLHVYGRVQGVGFRYACWRKASSLGLTGWVRNLPDESVEIVAEGPEEMLKALDSWCVHGPPQAMVVRVLSTPEPAQGKFHSFAISEAWDS